MAQVTVICTVPRAGTRVLQVGDEWTVSAEKASRLIGAGHAKLKDPADASKLPKPSTAETVAPVESPVQQDVVVGDEHDETDAINATDAAPTESTPTEKKPATSLQRAKASRKKAA